MNKAPVLNEKNFVVYAMNIYDNPSCFDIEEFNEDLKRFQYLKKLFKKYEQTNELKERLILNHMVILFNVFGLKAADLLFYKLKEYHMYLKPFMEYLNYLPNTVEYDNVLLMTKYIESDVRITRILKEI